MPSDRIPRLDGSIHGAHHFRIGNRSAMSLNTSSLLSLTQIKHRQHEDLKLFVGDKLLKLFRFMVLAP